MKLVHEVNIPQSMVATSSTSGEEAAAVESDEQLANDSQELPALDDEEDPTSTSADFVGRRRRSAQQQAKQPKNRLLPLLPGKQIKNTTGKKTPVFLRTKVVQRLNTGHS